MKIIGHRGAAGLELENTVAAIKAGIKAGAPVVEFDVRLTGDNQLVLCHDATLLRTFGINRAVRSRSLKELKALCPDLPTLDEALQACTCKGVIIELKVAVEPQQLLSTIKQYPNLDIRIVSFLSKPLRAIKKQDLTQACYLLQHRHWRRALQTITSIDADGLGLHYAAMNPFLYWIARRRHLELYVYTLNNPWIARLYNRLYPQVSICTDNPKLLRSK